MRLRSTAAASVLFGAVVTLGFTGTANAADRDCPDFATQAEAQAAYDAVPGDPERLDGNNDGEACEDYDYASVGVSVSTGTTSPTSTQVAARPQGAVAAGDGSASDEGSPLPYVLGGLAFAGAGGAAMVARRNRTTA